MLKVSARYGFRQQLILFVQAMLLQSRALPIVEALSLNDAWRLNHPKKYSRSKLCQIELNNRWPDGDCTAERALTERSLRSVRGETNR